MRKVLIANRGEIACRIIRSCRALGLGTVAVHSEADANALHVELADEAIGIGPAPAAESYLKTDRVLEAARESSADAIHPGYGFLAENPRFAEAVDKAGLVWIGPRAKTIEDMGDKERARLLAKSAGVPVLPGSARFAPNDIAGIEAAAEEVGYPLLVKAASGGGGIGMQRVDSPDKLVDTVQRTQTMAEKSFGDGTVYLEHLVARARHIEVQVFGNGDGGGVHMFERDCSVQRRFQKIVEESPAPGLPEGQLERMFEAAVALTHQERYRGAGTVEFVYDADADRFYFLEMNTRIQVEHPVTEMVTDLDLVGLQIQLAAGSEDAHLSQEDVVRSGHAIECRIYAERPAKNFMPSPGTLEVFKPCREGDGVRLDTGVREGDKITFYYDPMIAKLVCHGENRDAALDRMAGALADFHIEGVHTNIDFLKRLMTNAAFRAGDVDTGFVNTHKQDLLE
jgi:3-methylcrotonyl-CoA carboxylase alpha subunit